MTQSQHSLRTLVSLVVLVASLLLVTHFVQKFGVVGGWGPGALLTAAIILSLCALWLADVLLTMRKVRYVCQGCKGLSAKLVKKEVKHGYSRDFYECESCGHSEEAKDLTTM